MNKTTILLTLLTTAMFAGCLSDDDGTPKPHEGVTDAMPSYTDPTPATVTGLEFVTQTLDADGEPLPTGAGIWTFGDFVFGSARSARFWIADVSDPERPVVVYQAPEGSNTPYARDADLILHDDGRRTLVLATQFEGMHFWDVTDPTAPEFLAYTLYDENSDDNPAVHNIAVIPGTTLVFNSQSGGSGRTNDLVDATDPSAPRVLGAYGDHGCHDITFYGTPDSDRFRAYCAGIERTEIWDLDGLDTGADDFGIELVTFIGCPPFDPEDPQSPSQEEAESCLMDSPFVGNPVFGGGVGPVGTEARTLHHLAMVNHDASILIIGDEYNGGGTPGACWYYDETTGESTPLGALWFYDISEETDPSMLSWITPETVPPTEGSAQGAADDQDPGSTVPNCTAHFGTLVPGEEKIVIAWYSAGVLLIDFTDPEAPDVLDQVISEGTNPWDARIHGGYVFTGDIGRGMDVLRLT